MATLWYKGLLFGATWHSDLTYELTMDIQATKMAGDTSGKDSKEPATRESLSPKAGGFSRFSLVAVWGVSAYGVEYNASLHFL